MTLSEYEAYMEAIDDVEERISDDSKFQELKIIK